VVPAGNVQQFRLWDMDVIMQRLREILTAAGKVMRHGSEGERRRAAVLLRECAEHCRNEKIAQRLWDMAEDLREGEEEMFWENWWWTWGYFEALADVAEEG
jgi:hypothetical protein